MNLQQINEQQKKEVENLLDKHLSHSENVIKTRILKKLNNLYDGNILLKSGSDAYVNLSDHILTNSQKEFLNLGINCHLPRKYSKLEKKTELELLYQKLLNLQKLGKIIINDNLADQLRGESTKHRYKYSTNILTSELRNAAKELRENENITFKKADKSSIYVLMNT